MEKEMYVSRVKLNMEKRNTIIAFANPVHFHGAIAHAFLNYEVARPLWRIDQINGEKYLLIVSNGIPNLASIVDQFGFVNETDTAQTKSYDNFLNNIENGTTWNFRLAANPVVCKGGHRVPHKTPEHQISWLKSRSGDYGFEVLEATVSGVSSFHLQRGGGSKKKSDMVIATYDGTLVVTDKIKFVNVLKAGFGHCKAYGAGLLTVVSG